MGYVQNKKNKYSAPEDMDATYQAPEPKTWMCSACFPYHAPAMPWVFFVFLWSPLH
jgi:hypothetical protein